MAKTLCPFCCREAKTEVFGVKVKLDVGNTSRVQQAAAGSCRNEPLQVHPSYQQFVCS